MSGQGQVVCKFQQYGHCKFSETCKHFHTRDTCHTENCDKIGRSARHPRVCKYFNKSGQCKFGTGCSYLYFNKSPNSDIINIIHVMQEELNLVTNSLRAKENEINKLEEKVNKLEKILKSKDNSVFEKLVKCTLCDYCCSSGTVLKRHMTWKHKTEPLRELPALPENKSSTLSPTSDTRLESSNFKSNFLVEDEVCAQDRNFRCECWGCKFTSKSKRELNKHISVEHIVDESFIYPDSSKETDCPDCDEIFLEDHNFARHVYEKHYYLATTARRTFLEKMT